MKMISFLGCWQKYLENDSQPFYNYMRSYKKDEEIVTFNTSEYEIKKLKKEYGTRVEKNEKIIRFHQTKDRIIKMLCDSIMNTENDDKLLKFYLSEIHPNAEQHPLESAASFEQKIIRKGSAYYLTIIAKNSAKHIKEVEYYKSLTQEEERNSYQWQKGYRWKIKDFGRYKRFVKDRRIPNLSQYFEEKDVPFEVVEYQLNEYEKYRDNIFELTYKLEESITEYDYNGVKDIEFENPRTKESSYEVGFKVYLEWLNINGIEYNEELISQCRNRFSHSEFPVVDEIEKIPTEKMREFEDRNEEKGYKSISDFSITEKIYKLYKDEIERITSKIELKKKSIMSE